MTLAFRQIPKFGEEGVKSFCCTFFRVCKSFVGGLLRIWPGLQAPVPGKAGKSFFKVAGRHKNLPGLNQRTEMAMIQAPKDELLSSE